VLGEGREEALDRVEPGRDVGVKWNVHRRLRSSHRRRINPMHLDMRQALRCHTKSKKERVPVPSSSGAVVCRMHGAGGGAPKGNRNALKHGGFTAEGLELKRQIGALARPTAVA
jgi:hypothetical protein